VSSIPPLEEDTELFEKLFEKEKIHYPNQLMSSKHFQAIA
jgi:hypothetical protein